MLGRVESTKNIVESTKNIVESTLNRVEFTFEKNTAPIRLSLV